MKRCWRNPAPWTMRRWRAGCPRPTLQPQRAVRPASGSHEKAHAMVGLDQQDAIRLEAWACYRRPTYTEALACASSDRGESLPAARKPGWLDCCCETGPSSLQQEGDDSGEGASRPHRAGPHAPHLGISMPTCRGSYRSVMDSRAGCSTAHGSLRRRAALAQQALQLRQPVPGK